VILKYGESAFENMLFTPKQPPSMTTFWVCWAANELTEVISGAPLAAHACKGARNRDGMTTPAAATVESKRAAIVTATSPFADSETVLLVEGPITCRTASCMPGRAPLGRGAAMGRAAGWNAG
jgi:hypothetical protein